jgi:hypothetical protein
MTMANEVEFNHRICQCCLTCQEAKRYTGNLKLSCWHIRRSDVNPFYICDKYKTSTELIAGDDIENLLKNVGGTSE